MKGFASTLGLCCVTGRIGLRIIASRRRLWVVVRSQVVVRSKVVVILQAVIRIKVLFSSVCILWTVAGEV